MGSADAKVKKWPTWPMRCSTWSPIQPRPKLPWFCFASSGSDHLLAGPSSTPCLLAHPSFCFVFRGFEAAVSAPCLRTNWPPWAWIHAARCSTGPVSPIQPRVDVGQRWHYRRPGQQKRGKGARRASIGEQTRGKHVGWQIGSIQGPQRLTADGKEYRAKDIWQR